MNNIEKQNFVKVWTTEYSYLSLYIFIQGYTTRSSELLGMGFKNIIFKYEKGLATVYRVNEEVYNLSVFYAQKSIDDINFLNNAIFEAYRLSNEILEIAKSESIFKKIEIFKKFQSILTDFLPYYLVFIWATDGVKNLGYYGKRKNEIESKCLDARHKTEKFYPDLEKIIIKQLYELSSEVEAEKLMAVLSIEEIEQYINEGVLPDVSTLNDRYELSVIMQTEKMIKFETKESAKVIVDRIENYDLDVSEFKGMPAMKGKIVGKVKIVFRDEDASKFEDGDVLVTTMTRPDWLPIMKKSSAYVTDAGGMLCHAAIVARELKKPCIIGTKIATKVLKDGDVVEVDADKGIVRILNKVK